MSVRCTSAVQLLQIQKCLEPFILIGTDGAKRWVSELVQGRCTTRTKITKIFNPLAIAALQASLARKHTPDLSGFTQSLCTVGLQSYEQCVEPSLRALKPGRTDTQTPCFEHLLSKMPRISADTCRFPQFLFARGKSGLYIFVLRGYKFQSRQWPREFLVAGWVWCFASNIISITPHAHGRHHATHQNFLQISQSLTRSPIRSGSHGLKDLLLMVNRVISCNLVAVVQHKAVTEVSQQETYRRVWLLWLMDGRVKPLMDRKVVGASGYISVNLSAYLCIHLSVYLCICVPVYLCIYLPNYLAT